MSIQTVFFAEEICKETIAVVQINLGDRCNQVCTHCHIGASPQGKKNMDAGTVHRIIERLQTTNIRTIEFTGGTPELNPHLGIFIEELSGGRKELAVRTSLTVLDLPEYASFVDLYRRHKVKIIASLPSVLEEETERQRGRGVFKKSIRVLKRLNALGYGTDGYALDLVHNPVGDSLPDDCDRIEREYRRVLRDEHGISFNRLITITNSPVGRFREGLEGRGTAGSYHDLLTRAFNSETLKNVMCRHLLSLDHEGFLYDCDFNLALGMKIKGYEDKRFWEIDLDDTFRTPISFGEHCYACTASRGSSCHGALVHRDSDTRKAVKLYYGDVLKSSSDLKTSACCPADSGPAHVREILPSIAGEIQRKFYGCGSPIPLAVHGLKVLDLGCGTGRDSYILSRLVGEGGFVCGIDMTEPQIAIARKYLGEQMGRFGYARPNVEFIHDYIENVGAHFADESLDLVVSNCVVNLVEDKEAVLREIHRILRPGGELYFSDVYADRRVPEHIAKDPLMYGECLGGALYYRDFERISRRVGFRDPRLVSKRVLGITNREVQEKIGGLVFFSMTYRLWKLDDLEEGWEDYGHTATYCGGIDHAADSFYLDAYHRFEKGRPERVCGNTALMLSKTRLHRFFDVYGDYRTHVGAFEKGQPADEPGVSESKCC